MKILAQAGRNKHRQSLVRAECPCGNEFVAIHNNIKTGRTKTCGHCGKPGKARTPQPVPEKPAQAPGAPTLAAPEPERGTPAWFRSQISIKTEAALRLETQANEFEREMKESGISSSFDGEAPDKLWARAVTTAKKLRQEIARLTNDLQKAETGVAKPEDMKSVTRNRIALLQGAQ
jgi:hypothetical protein